PLLFLCFVFFLLVRFVLTSARDSATRGIPASPPADTPAAPRLHTRFCLRPPERARKAALSPASPRRSPAVPRTARRLHPPSQPGVYPLPAIRRASPAPAPSPSRPDPGRKRQYRERLFRPPRGSFPAASRTSYWE